ncbi:hypothetical protein DCAR_0104866 [Daucus carota subsp. sativus]|uniref:Agglutinin domain-containing protein n=1 Tax=Daucus carota subsp. sativus TaxID=79200 RepID=A0AAF0WCU1_DAUCS|nr:hypothetical protein DCAR_0104866 [Daucus carota subsp. sativus]
MSQQVVALPRFVEFRSQNSNKLLRYVKEDGAVKGYVQFYGDFVGSADAKFEVHRSTTVNGLVHIRSCYNNKFLQVLDKAPNLLAAKADKPDEDQSSRSCTLLRPTSVNGNPKTIRLTHVNLKLNLCLWRGTDPAYYACVAAYYSDPDAGSCDVFNVIDWQSLVILPKYIALKGDNNKFVTTIWYYGKCYLQFSATNLDDDPLSAGNEIVQTSNGNISIRNLNWDKYWRSDPHIIYADSTVPTSNDALFQPVKCSEDTIALRSIANNYFCTMMTNEIMKDCLTVGSTAITSFAKFKVSEFVVSKTIENINFRLMDARIYDENMLVMVSSTYANQGNSTQEQTFELSYRNKRSSTWNCNLSVKGSFEASFKAGIPFIEDGKITFKLEASEQYTWGKTKEAEEKISTSYKVTIAPKTKVTVRIVATRGICDVPFCYDQRDVLYTGETVITQMDDGVYTGVNNYSIYTEEKEEPLNQSTRITAAAGFKRVAKVSQSGVITRLKHPIISYGRGY